ncbi:ABC transporter ATP-binding protein [Phycicoccus sp. M110.8]|uniref:ABC transporter ATP-binding protein n=1 Tax=Phycicoccus sp. M110.8 TaxID=3075433 RepID=UPI0028FD36BD|nr:ABC transporter ATP-binding protein [Phycicoccus sp. M110.8]MDU0315882.1 ABC transporter ATP-binding protein [Phycicoccus sp. M110.8]
MSMSGWMAMRSLTRDDSVKDRKLAPGTARRTLSYARSFKREIAVFVVVVVLDAALVVATPLLLKDIVDRGIIPRDRGVVVELALLVAAIAVADGALTLVSRWYSARIGEGLIYHLRTEVFAHVLRQPIAFFTRAQTGALVSRLNSDVLGAQQAFTSVLSSVVSNVVSLALIIGTMATLSWQLTLASLALVPFFIVPARWMGRRLAGLSHAQMGLNADMGTRMTERFNVAGALLVKLFGDARREDEEYAERAAGVRDMGVKIAMNRSIFFVALTLVASLATAMVYGFGGLMAVGGTLTVGTLLALTALLARLYGPLTAISNVRVDVMTALVSFERVFEVLDLEPLVQERPGARRLPDGPVSVELDGVGFRYPSADDVSLASLESTAVGDRKGSGAVLRDVTFTVEPGQLVALVGPSGAGKTTITSLVARLYDPTTGAVRINGVDLRDATLDSVHATVGVVTQEAHLFHDTIRANLAYAAPDATEEQMVAALRAAHVWALVDALPEGLDTVVGDRGHRLSGGEKQRLALARLLLKGPGLIVLDEATAHLDSESEAAVQRALDTALTGRTALVIAHRLSTVRGADQILVVDAGRIVERGTHTELMARRGLYRDLYTTQFADQESDVPA